MRGNLEHPERSSSFNGCERSPRSARSEETQDTLTKSICFLDARPHCIQCPWPGQSWAMGA
eukprot:8401581-Pyramimonas_sp.AAC.1